MTIISHESLATQRLLSLLERSNYVTPTLVYPRSEIVALRAISAAGMARCWDDGRWFEPGPTTLDWIITQKCADRLAP